jgi:proteasome lid subunit RPN8/RPN11
VELVITSEQLSLIGHHCQQAYPREGCGILLGLAENGVKIVADVLPTDNAREEVDQHNRYLIPPESLLQSELQAEERGLEVVGYFHSHPDHPARPSEYDREHAWPWYSYLITSVRNGKAVDSRSWQLRADGGGFDEEHVVRTPPGQHIQDQPRHDEQEQQGPSARSVHRTSLWR